MELEDGIREGSPEVIEIGLKNIGIPCGLSRLIRMCFVREMMPYGS